MVEAILVWCHYMGLSITDAHKHKTVASLALNKFEQWLAAIRTNSCLICGQMSVWSIACAVTILVGACIQTADSPHEEMGSERHDDLTASL